MPTRGGKTFIASEIIRIFLATDTGNFLFIVDSSDYRCKTDTIAGQSPETNPEKWISQGGSVGTIGIDSIIDLRSELTNLQNEDSLLSVSIQTTNQI